MAEDNKILRDDYYEVHFTSTNEKMKNTVERDYCAGFSHQAKNLLLLD